MPPPMPPQGANPAQPPQTPPNGGSGESSMGPDMNNPQNANKDGSIIFLDKGMFEDDPAVGEEICVICKVTSRGDKIGLTPLRVEDITEPAEGEDQD